MSGTIYTLKRSLAEDFHAGIVAHGHWPVGLEELVVTPPTEGLEVVERQIKLVFAQLSTRTRIAEEILPEKQLTLKSDRPLCVEVQVEGEGAQVGAGRPETPDKVRNAHPELVNGVGFELPGDAMGLELGRQSTLDLCCGEQEIGLGAGLPEEGKIHSHLPLLFLLVEGGKNKGFFEVAAVLEAEEGVLVDGRHVPEVGDACQCEWEQAKKKDIRIQLCHEINIKFRQENQNLCHQLRQQQTDNILNLDHLYYARFYSTQLILPDGCWNFYCFGDAVERWGSMCQTRCSRDGLNGILEGFFILV